MPMTEERMNEIFAAIGKSVAMREIGNGAIKADALNFNVSFTPTPRVFAELTALSVEANTNLSEIEELLTDLKVNKGQEALEGYRGGRKKSVVTTLRPAVGE